ncbi:MAG: thioredoxin family protein [Sphingobacteriales bacterium JAD_PAG50586_3]|nr:MAG: thioredoxin family protein [Sphingobacteriales bacterium JAD_PAG50586_3]
MNKVFSRLIVLFLLFAGFAANAQGLAGGGIDEPVEWSVEFKKTSDTDGEIILTAVIDKGYDLYSQYNPPSKDGLGGGQPLRFTYKPNKDYAVVGKTIEPAYKKHYNDIWESDEYFFLDKAVFKQKVKINTKDYFVIKGSVEGQACVEGMCKQTAYKFSVEVNVENKGKNGDTTTAVAPAVKVDSAAIIAGDAPLLNDKYFAKMQKIVDGKYEAACGNVESQKLDLGSLWSVFFLAFGAGLLALLMPCLFPLIPLNVSFFTKHSPTRAKGIFNAIVYGISIIFIFVIPGYLVTKIFGSDALNALSTSAFFNWLFFIVFMLFAISFFGAFEITLPSRFVNSVDKQSDRGGIIGIFFMAFTLVLVSFSCTGPLLGTLMVEAVYKGGDLALVIGLLGFGIGLALPFMLLAIFPSWLSTLPKSGGWLNTVKVTFGFIELALAMKFISNIDLAYHWDFLKRELFVSIWVAIFGAMALYLFGKIRTEKEAETKGVGTFRMMFALATLSFTVYLSTGLFGGPLNLLAGYIPPAYYNERNIDEGHCPPGYNCFNDLDAGMNYAKQQGKPVMLDFTGYNCANCRQMEDNVFVKPGVKKLISKDYVLISLYCDDKESLLPEDRYTSTFSGEEITTVGGKWSDLQKMVYNANAQPMYVLVDNDGKLLNAPRNFNLDVGAYEKFLRDGLCRYDARKK